MDDLNKVIQLIAEKHGIVLKKDDPILMLHTYFTVFEKSLEQLYLSHQQLLLSYQEENYKKWSDESKKMADSILDSSLKKSSEQATANFAHISDALLKKLDHAITMKIAEVENKQVGLLRLVLANMFTTGFLAITACFIYFIAS